MADKPFSHQRWNDTLEAEVVGHKETTEKEEREAGRLIDEMVEAVEKLED